VVLVVAAVVDVTSVVVVADLTAAARVAPVVSG
jgi:hypothetical protein